MALSQMSSDSIGRPRTRFPHFCWGVEEFDVHQILRALAAMETPARSVLREGQTINGVNFDDPDGFPLQFNPVIACGGGGFLGEVCDASATAVQRPGEPPPLPVRTLNHIKMMVPDVQRSMAWHLRLTDMRLQSYQEPEEGPRTLGYSGPPIPILRVGPGPQFVALIEGSGPEAYRPHVGLGVEGFDPDEAVERLAEHGVRARTRMREGVTPEILVDAPDGVQLQLQGVSYCGGGGRLGDVC